MVTNTLAVRYEIPRILSAVLSKVDDFATFKKVEVHAKKFTF